MVVVLGVIFAVAMLCMAFAYTAARDDADVAAARFSVLTKRNRALAVAVQSLGNSMDASFAKTDTGVVTGAKRAMGVLGDAIRRESRVVQTSVGRNSRAIAALSALLDANAASIRELMEKISTEDRAALAQRVAQMDARHAELVAYLSGGGMDRVAEALTAAAVGTEAFTAEHFSTPSMLAALKTFGITLDEAALSQLDADLKADVAKGLSLREAMFLRLSAIEPVARGARAAEDAHREADAAGGNSDVFVALQASDDAHREAIRAAMADQHALIQSNSVATAAAIADQRARMDAAQQANRKKLAATSKAIRARVDSAQQANQKMLAATSKAIRARMDSAQQATQTMLAATSQAINGNLSDFKTSVGATLTAQQIATTASLTDTLAKIADVKGALASIATTPPVVAPAPVVTPAQVVAPAPVVAPAQVVTPAPVVVPAQGGKLSEQKYGGYYNDKREFFATAAKTGAPAFVTTVKKGLEGENYSYRWTGKFRPVSTGEHEFWTRSDDASHVFVNGGLVVNNGGIHGVADKSGKVTLSAGTVYDLEVLFGQAGGGAEMWMQWHGPAQAWQTDLSPVLVQDISVPAPAPSVASAGPASGVYTVKTTGMPAPAQFYVENATDGGSWLLVYETVTPSRNGSGVIPYSVNKRTDLGAAPVKRIAYRLQNGGQYAWVSFDAWTNGPYDVPTGGAANNVYAVRRSVTNMRVISGSPSVTNTNSTTGTLEIWPSNYATGPDGKYDGNDVGFDTGIGYGSFQVHDAANGKVVFAWNNHGSPKPDVGFGNAPGPHPDWTFVGNGAASDFKLQIFVFVEPGV